MDPLGFARDVVLPIITLVVFPLVLWFLRDRRKSQAESDVAERTIGSDVATKDIGAASASVAFVQEAFRVERESKDREIRNLAQKVKSLEASDEAKNTIIREQAELIGKLKDQVAALAAKVDRLEASPT